MRENDLMQMMDVDFANHFEVFVHSKIGGSTVHQPTDDGRTASDVTETSPNSQILSSL